ncbi:DNA-processing protein DprA [Hoylesella shahii]|jgi:DNA protecting protein dprA|uniref:DNA processing protein n=2 Tax=Hoylesella shahii TaxID=228603 RepID=A0A318HXD8_9BACT|nr:DNA-processing protein DprA [Hoylesella shahii]PXX23134.1 DNA processing protein [Hoylesella shahii DSM 15611 = JCM 12083]
MNHNETRNAIALTRVNYFNLAGLAQLYRKLGSATEVIAHRNNLKEVLPDASPRLLEAMHNIEQHLRVADAEMEYNARNNIKTLCLADNDYPQRLKNCADAPLVLFFKGNTDLNRARVINVVGTRHCTAYGQDVIRKFFTELKKLSPEVLVVSGLAYGVDINAHRQALANDLDTVAVLAHGLDNLYPARHKQTADEMIKHGGLLTEFLTNTNADKLNFVRRNRIVAGMSDACVLVESAAHGGGLITTAIARDYSREVFAFPGAVGAPFSEGCNNLIRDHKAQLITSAADFIQALGWETDFKRVQATRQGIERQLFPELSAEEQTVIEALQSLNDQPISQLSLSANIPISRLTVVLFQLEMKGMLKLLAGGCYHLYT